MSQSKKYIIEVATNKASLEKLRSDLLEATKLPKESVDAPALSREAKAQVKKDLATMFGVAEHQADALRKMMQAAADGFADGKSVEEMKNQLKETLEFTNTIMRKMQQMGDATSWMDRGVTFVDDFIKMKDSIGSIKEVESSIRSLEKTFGKFKDALAETNADAFLQRFGNSTRSEAESLAKAQKELDRIAKNRTKALQNIMRASSDEEYDYSGFSVEEIKSEYKIAMQTIEDANKEIDVLRSKFKGKTKELYNSKDYQDQIAMLSDAMNQIKNLPGITGDGLDGNLKATLKEATDSVKSASTEIKNIINSIQGDGIELSITLPEASSAKFVTKIDKFVKDATKQFKTKPIEIAATVKNPFKETKTEAGEESNNIADNFTKSITTVKNAINSGYNELRGAINSENSLLNREMFLKFGYKKSETDDVIIDALTSMQNTIYESNPLELKFNTESIAEKLAKDIQQALNSVKMPSMPSMSVANTGNIPMSTVPVRILGGLPLKIETPDESKQSRNLPVQKKLPTPPAQKHVDEKMEAVQNETANAIKISSNTQRSLSQALTNLNATIQAQDNIIKRNQAIIDDNTAKTSGEEETKEINGLKSDIVKLKQQLAEPAKKEQLIKDEQKKLYTRYEHAKSAYDIRYNELSSNEAYKDIKELDERLRILRDNRDRTDKDYREQISAFDKKIEKTKKNLGKSEKEDAEWNEIIEGYSKQRAEIENKRQKKLEVLDAGIEKVETDRRNALSTNDVAQQIAKELEPFALAVVEARKKLNAKSQELHEASLEPEKIREEIRNKEEQLEHRTHSKEISNAKKEIDNAQKKIDPIVKRRDMVKSILDNNQDPVKLVLDTTNEFWESSAKTIKSAQNSMLRYASDDAMKAKLKDVFEKQAKLESLDPIGDDYKALKTTVDGLWNEINVAAKSLTGKNAKNFNVAKSKYDNSYTRRNSMALLGLTDMSDIDEEEALGIVTSLLKKNKVTSSGISKIKSTSLLKDLNEYVKISKTALGIQDQTDEQYDADVKAQNAFLQTARNMELLKRLYKAFPKGDNLPSAATIENFIKAFSGFEEMGDVVESATQYLHALDEVNKITAYNPAFKSLSAPEIVQKLYGNLSDDAKSKLSTALDGYGLKGVDISTLEGDALVDAVNKMTIAFQGNMFDNLGIDEKAINGIVNVLQRNVALMSAQNQLKQAVDSRGKYLDNAKYTAQGRTPRTSRTKTDNVYDILKANEPLSVEVINDGKSRVASIYNPKGSPGQADEAYKATSYGFSNFLYKHGLKDEVGAIVEASIRETYLDNILKRLESWGDGYKPTQSEIIQMFDSLGDGLKPEDYIDEDGAVIEVEELRAYVQRQKEDMVTAQQLLNELVSSGKIRIALGKNSILPNYAKDGDKYKEIETTEQKYVDKEAEVERTITQLRALTTKDQAKKMQDAYNALGTTYKSRFDTILGSYGLKDIDISKLDGEELVSVFDKIKITLSNESELEALINSVKSQNPKDQATEMQSLYNNLSDDSKAKINTILGKYGLKGDDISKLKGDKLINIFDVMKKALYEDGLRSLDGLKNKDGEPIFSSLFGSLNIDQKIAEQEAKLTQLREIRIAQEQEVDKIIAIDNDIAVHEAKANQAKKGVDEAKGLAKNLNRWGNKSNYYKNATNKEKHKYEYGRISIDELLENINFAKIYGIGDVSKLEEVASIYNKAVAEQSSLEESGATGDELQAAIKAVDDAKKELINKYFSTDGWYITKYLREQFANIDSQNEGKMQSVQNDLENEMQKQKDALSELENAHVQRVQQIANETTQLLSTYIESPATDVNSEKHQRKKIIADKRKEIDKQIAGLSDLADTDPKIAKLRAEAMKSLQTDEYKALYSMYQKVSVSDNPADKELAKTYKAQLDAYEADYNAAKAKWIKTRTDSLNKELEVFIQSLEQDAYPKANEHANKISEKRADIEKRKKALTKEVNKADEVKSLKSKRDSIERKIKTADEVGDVASSRALKKEYVNADERYRIAKASWIAKKSADLDKELSDFIEGLETEGRSVEKFNTNLPEGAQAVTSSEEIRTWIKERNARLLQEENERFKQELDASTKSASGPKSQKQVLEEEKKKIDEDAQIERQKVINKVTSHGQVMTDSQFMASQHEAMAASRAEEVKAEREEVRLLKEKREVIASKNAINDEIIAERKSAIKVEQIEQQASTSAVTDSDVMISESSGAIQFLSTLDVSSLTAASMSVDGGFGNIVGLLSDLAKEGTLSSIASTLSSGIKVKSDNQSGGGKKGGKKKSGDKPLNVTADDAWTTAQDYIKTNYPNFTSLGSLRPVSGGYSIDVFQPKNLEEYAAAQQRVNALIAEGKQDTEEYNQALAERNGLALEQEKITLRIGQLNDQIQVTQEKSGFQNLAIGVKAASKELQTVEDVLLKLHDAGALTIGADGRPDSYIASVKNYISNLNKLRDYHGSLSPDQLFDPIVNQKLSSFALDLQNSRKEMMALIKASSQLNIGDKIETDKLVDGIKELSDGDIRKLMQEIVSGSTELETNFRELTPVANEFGETIGYKLAYTVQTGKHEVQEMTAVLNPLTNELRVQKGAVKEVATGWQQFFSGLKGKAASIMQYLISITSIHDVFRYFSQGVQYVRDIDAALTELKKVTDETDASYAKFLQDMSQTGSVIGATVSNLTTMAAEWSRLGYSMQEAGQLAKSTAILLNVSEFDDATEASEALISTMQAFGYAADESQHVVDILNEVGNNYAVSSDGLATALQDSASSLMTAGATLEESVALIAAANKVVQDPNSVGSALRTISLRLRGTSVEVLEEMGEETDNVIESTSKLQEKILALSGVNILSTEGGYRNPYEILKDIAEVYDSIDPMDQAALIELIAGKNRANTLAAILTNFEDLDKAYKSALNAEGSALRENAAYLDSIQGRIDLFTNAMQTMWMNFINADVVKFIVDVGTGLIQLVDTVGVLKTAFAGLFAGMFAKHQLKKNNINLLDFIFDVAPDKIKNSAIVKDFGNIFKSVRSEILANSLSKISATDMLIELAGLDDTNEILPDISKAFGINGENIFTKTFSKDQVKKVLDGFDDISDATKTAILNSNLFATSQTGAAVGTDILTASLAKAKAAAIAFCKGLMDFAAAHPIIAGLTVAVLALGAAFAAYDALTTSHDEYVDKLSEETDALKSIQSELKSVQSELATTSARMDELNAKETLSFVEEEELARLKEQTAELERQEAILAAQEKRARNKQIETALNAIKTDSNYGRTTAVVDTSYAAAYGISLPQNMYAGGIPYAVGLQNTGLPTQSIDNKYESNLKLLQEAKEELDAAQHEFLTTVYTAEDAEYQTLKKNLEDAQARVDKYNDAIDSMNESWQTKYGEVGYVENATTEAEKQWNEFYRQHQDYLDQQAMINGVYGKATVLDRIFGITATDVAKTFKEEFEKGVKAGGDPVTVIEGLFSRADYSSAFVGLEKQFGITMDNIKNYFTQTGEFAIDYDFDITKYTKYISSHSAAISEFQEAIQKLDKGSFTMDDFMSLIERFPDLAKGVDISSNAFYGLSRNLNRAIKSRTKDFVKDLQKLKESMKAAGKETDSVDQLIEAIENMPDDALDNTIAKYNTLADSMDRAKTANERLLASMEENPNAEYENRGTAIEYMKEAMKRGEIGSESNLWNVAKEYGFTKDIAKIINPEVDSLNDYADALATYIATRDTWFKQDDDGNYTYKGTENFIKSVEKVTQSSEFKKAMQEAGVNIQEFLWDYDETTGNFKFNLDNKDLPKIIEYLSQTKELVGINELEWMDLMKQVGQFFDINFEDAQDVSDYIAMLAEGSGNASSKIEQMTDAVETYVEKALGEDLDFSSLTDASIEALNCDESIKQLLRTYLSLKESLEDPLNIGQKIEESGGAAQLLEMDELGGSLTRGETGYTLFNTDTFTSVLKEAGYTEDKINSLIEKIKEYQSIITISNDDPLGLNSQNKNMQSVISAVQALGVEYKTVTGAFGEPIGININATDLITSLQSKGWTPDKISSYLQTLTSETNGLGVQVDGKVNLNPEEISAMIETANETAQAKVTFSPDTTAIDEYVPDNKSAWVKFKANYDLVKTSIPPTKYGTVIYEEDGSSANGTVHANGTAHATGSWGAPKTETALVGELGPELLVRNGRWTTIGDNGAEFTQIKKGDIIFNHKQTRDLLSKGYVTGRGKLHGGLSAFASGTAYIDGDSYFGRYEFDGNGSWKEYDVNNKLVDSMDGATSALSKAADALSDSSDEFSEVFDWIEVRIEELDETLGLLESQIESAVYYTDKNTIIDDLIDTNKTKLDNLNAGYKKYAAYAEELLAKVPAEYRDAVKNGAIEIEAFVGEADETTLKAIQNYREWVQKSADFKQQANEIITTIRDLAIQKFDNAYEAGDVRATVEDSQTEKLQNAVDYDEERGLITSDEYYVAMMENSNKKIEYLTEARKAMQKELNAAVEAGQITRGSNEWYELIDQMYQVDAQIDEATIELEEFQNAINDIYWENFDQLISRIDYLKDDTQSLIDLMNHDDLVADPTKRKYKNGTIEYWTSDDVQWTDEGLASLGLYAQQMEISEYRARQYAKAIDDLTKEYKAGHYSENEYLEKLNELKDAQYESIESYYDAQDAIKDLNETRIDSIKKGIEKEIEAYEELIEAKKELLDSEKDAYDFQKNVLEQQKSIGEIERQLAAIANDHSLSAAAKRKQLEAELAEAQYELQDTYYERSIEDKQTALDKELEKFQEEKDAEITKWEEYLDNVEKVVTDSLNIVQSNAAEIAGTLTSKTEEYNLTVSDAVLSPWRDGAIAVSDYQSTFDTAMSSTMNQLEALKNKWQEVIDKMADVGNANVNAINQENAKYAELTKKEPVTNNPAPANPTPSNPTVNNSTTKEENSNGKNIVVGGKIDATGAKIYKYAGDPGGDLQYFSFDPIYTVLEEKDGYLKVRYHKSSSGMTGWFKKSDVKAYAKGTTGVKNNQLALIDELGEELVMHASGGKLAYLTKGSAVIPHNISENLMTLGTMDPQDMLDRNRPSMNVHPEVHNTEVNLSMTYGDILHIDNFNGDNHEDIAKLVAKQFEKHTKDLNNAIRKYTR